MAAINTLDCSVFTRFFGYWLAIGWLCPKINALQDSHVLCTVQSVTNLPPGCVLPSTTACIHMRLNSQISWENRDLWSGLHPPTTMFCNNGLPLYCCDFSWHNATMRTDNGLVVMHTQSTKFCHGCVGEFLSMAFHGVLFFYSWFLFWEVSCDFNRIHSR